MVLTVSFVLLWAVVASKAKQSMPPPKEGLLRRGACHRARIRATRWLLAMTRRRDQIHAFFKNSVRSTP